MSITTRKLSGPAPALIAVLLAATLLLALGCSSPAASTPEPTLSLAQAGTATPAPTDTPTLSPTSTATLVATTTATPPLDPQPGAAGIGDPYFPLMGNGGYDVQHYTLDLAVDMASNTISGTATVEAVATHDLSAFNLDFAGLQISRVLVGGAPADFSRDGAELTIVLPQPVAQDQSFTTAITYSGVPGEGLEGTTSPFSRGWNHYGAGVYVAGEPTGASRWYPVNEHPRDKASYTFRIVVPQPYMVAANGVPLETVENGNTATYVWEARDPMASYLVTVNIAEAFEVETESGPGGLPIRNYFAAGIPEATRDSFAPTGRMIDLFSDLFGPYPFEVYGVVVHDVDLSFALETQTLSLFGRRFTTEQVVVHELSHQWFGNSVSLMNWRDIWLNEGFATYSEMLWTEHTQGPEALEQAVRTRYRNMALGEQRATLSREDFLGRLRALPLGGMVLSRQQIGEALDILFAATVPEGERSALLDQVPPEGLPAAELPDLLEGLSFDRITLTGSQVNRLFRALGLEHLVSPANEAPVPPGNPPPDNLFNRSVYERGGLTLHALRLEVGDEAFFDILPAYFSRFANGNASTDDFIAVAEEVSGRDLDSLFDAWLYDVTMPDLPQMGLFREDFAP